MTSHPRSPAPPVPRWLRAVLKCDRAGSSWYVGMGFFFAPALAVVSPWPAVTAALWVLIALAGLWLGLLGIAMATGLALVLRSGQEIPEDYWRSILDYPTTPEGAGVSNVSAPRPLWRRRCSRPASA
ncbi:hypothetical protein MARA_08850 [Mycolicibacterium arabiense]|uniref:Uncharacterized protein n=1 Tax=Mycolicibacterium arabiense TaxID=1286181 RepID=A0A7I7RSA4_9MYCO|nr:hypothetical protein [Mycolicibacterium arabiense]MCV7375919.1 hypothetical protein [Mycolicibacterium arabiense]BBY47417.1 hypothetical protein MARA_08850 [Mycolicibacterium arabiense]